MSVTAFDHVAIPVAHPEQMLDFYRTLGFGAPATEEWRANPARPFAVTFGNNKINMHPPEMWQNAAFTLRGPTASPGCGDFCFVWSGTPEALHAALQAVGAAIELGPVARLGGRAGGTMGTSVYSRDPDGNLIEFIIYAD